MMVTYSSAKVTRCSQRRWKSKLMTKDSTMMEKANITATQMAQTKKTKQLKKAKMARWSWISLSENENIRLKM